MKSALDITLSRLFNGKINGEIHTTRLQDYGSIRTYFVWKKDRTEKTSELRIGYLTNLFLSIYMRDNGRELFATIEEQKNLYGDALEDGVQMGLVADGFATYIDKNFTRLQIVIDDYMENPIEFDRWQKIFNPSVFEVDTLPDDLKDGDVVAIVYGFDNGQGAPYILVDDKRWLTENIAYAGFVNAQINPDKIALVLFSTLSEEEALRMKAEKVFNSLKEGNTLILFYKIKISPEKHKRIEMFRGAYTAIKIEYDGRDAL